MIRLLAALMLGLVALPTWAQSFDCADATSSIELAICSDEDLAGLDEAITDTYRDVRDSLPAEHRESVTAMQQAGCRSRSSGDPNRRGQDWSGRWESNPPHELGKLG